ncbi:hypothetical protein [Flavobacterium sp.]|uniref:hypothetical protein n=1 Tax=Flavobacterium sp. TaxID=239 RepID=UPI0037C03910
MYAKEEKGLDEKSVTFFIIRVELGISASACFWFLSSAVQYLRLFLKLLKESLESLLISFQYISLL